MPFFSRIFSSSSCGNISLSAPELSQFGHFYSSLVRTKTHKVLDLRSTGKTAPKVKTQDFFGDLRTLSEHLPPDLIWTWFGPEKGDFRSKSGQNQVWGRCSERVRARGVGPYTGDENRTRTFFSLTFRATWHIPAKSRDIPPKKLVSLGIRRTYRTFSPPPLHVKDPHLRISGPESLGSGSFSSLTVGPQKVLNLRSIPYNL